MEKKAGIKEAAGLLNLIVVGGLLCIFDIEYKSVGGGTNWRIDVLNDSLGTILILIGVIGLTKFQVSRRYTLTLKAILLVLASSFVETLIKHAVMPFPGWLTATFHVFSLARLVAIVFFCGAMIELSSQAGLARAALSFRLTRKLFLGIYVIPLGAVYLTLFAVWASGAAFQLASPLILLALPVLAIPLIHLFVSTRRMAAEAEARAPEAPAATAIPKML